MVVAQQASGTGQTPPPSHAITLCYKRQNVRLETAGGPIFLYDGKSGFIQTLDAAHKTYYMALTTQIEQAADSTPPWVGSQVKEDTKLDLRQTNQTMTLAGMAAHQYILTGTITYTRSRPQGGRRGGGGGGHRHGGGEFPGGFPLVGPTTVDQNGGGGYGGGASLALPQWNLSGELWLSDTVKFPARENTLPDAQLITASACSSPQPLSTTSSFRRPWITH